MAEEPADRSEAEEVPDLPPWATLPRPARGRLTPMEAIRDPSFPLALRGYDRAAVDRYVAEVLRVVTELEATQLRQTVVQRALDEVGEQTSEILRQAHEAAEEITAHSRAQAEGRLSGAERDAERVLRDAEDAVKRLEGDNRHLWAERERLIEDLRVLAQDVIELADGTRDRLTPPAELLRENVVEEGRVAEAEGEGADS